MASIDKAILARRAARERRDRDPLTSLQIFGRMIMGDLDEKGGYLSSLHRPIGHQAFFFICLFLAGFALVFIFGKHV